jgi:hypothetical protein
MTLLKRLFGYELSDKNLDRLVLGTIIILAVVWIVFYLSEWRGGTISSSQGPGRRLEPGPTPTVAFSLQPRRKCASTTSRS